MWTPLDLFSAVTWSLITCIVILAWYHVHRKWQYLRDLNIPHDPPSLFTLGHMRRLLGKEAFTFDNDMKKKYGPIWGSYFLLTPGITIHDPDILKKILIKEFHSFTVRRKRLTNVNGKELNESLTNVQGCQWKRIRSTLTPTFSTSKLRQMTYIMDRCINNASRALDDRIESEGGVFNPKEFFARLSLDAMCSAAFSTEVDSKYYTDKEPEIMKQSKKLFEGSFFRPLVLLCLMFPPFEDFLAYIGISVMPNEPLSYFKALTYHVINQRKADPDRKHGLDLMQIMLNAEISQEEARSGKFDKGMDRNEIVGNAMAMLFAEYENTANAMSHLAYNLAQHPEIQEKLRKEIDEMVERKGVFDYDSVVELKFLDMCVNETLRLYNPILRNARVCEKEVTINGFTIPKGITVNVPAYALTHDPEFWDEPEEFNPERMRDMSQIDPVLYQPFGVGPRACIGLRFALIEIKVAIAKLIHKYRFEAAENTPEPPLKLKICFSVRPVVDYNLKIVRRHKTE